MGSRKPDYGDGAGPGKIFIGGLAKDVTLDQFVKYFGKYGEITDSVIMKDRDTGRPRGFGFITYADPVVVDSLIAETHIINNKQVEIKRTIPKGSAESKDFRTKKIFVGGIPTSLSEDEFKSFFSKYGTVIEHEIIRDHVTKRSRSFGFIVFDSDQVVDTILSNGNSIDMDGTQVEIKKAEPKKPSYPASAPAFPSKSRGHSYTDYGGFDNSYTSFRTGGFASAPYRSFGNRFGDYGGYWDTGAGKFGGYYGDFSGGNYVGKSGDYSGYVAGGANRYGPYGGGFGEGYNRSGLGTYGRGGGYDGYSGAAGGYSGGTGPGSGAGYESGPGAGYESGPGAGYESGPGAGYESCPGAGYESCPGAGYGVAGGLYVGRTGYSSGGRYHPYTR